MRKNTMNFTKSQLAELPAAEPGKRNCYYDTKMDGLELRITDTGSKSFSLYKWVNGKNVRLVLGRYNPDAIQAQEFDDDPLCVLTNNPGLGIEHARQLAAAVLMQLTAGKDPVAGRRATKGLTLGELFQEYLHGYAIDHTKTWKVMEECFHRYLGEWKNRPVNSIKRADVQLLINKLGRENGKTTANRTLELLRAIINKGKKWAMFDGENPATGITKFKLKPRERFAFDEELPRLVAAIEAEPNPDIRDYILMMLYSGARKSNVLTMRWEHVDLDAGTWVIPDTKNGTSQTILLTEPELEIMQRRLGEGKKQNHPKISPYVFPGVGAAGHLADPKKGWYRILERAKIKDLHLHDLRRTLGSYMAMTGASLSVIGNALNHKDVSTTRKVYAHSAREAERSARQVAHARMFGNETKAPVELAKVAEQAVNTAADQKGSIEF